MADLFAFFQIAVPLRCAFIYSIIRKNCLISIFYIMCFAKKIVLKEKKHTKSIRGKNILLRIVSGFCPHFVPLWSSGFSGFKRLTETSPFLYWLVTVFDAVKRRWLAMNSIFCSYEEQICIKLAKTHKKVNLWWMVCLKQSIFIHNLI